MDKLSLEEVLELIKEESEYQREKRSDETIAAYGVSDWLILIRAYLNVAENAVFEQEETDAMAAIRRIMAIGIRAMENKGCPSRDLNFAK